MQEFRIRILKFRKEHICNDYSAGIDERITRNSLLHFKLDQ